MQASEGGAVVTEAVISEAVLREKVIGCWLGKAVGGTLGMPFEGQDGPHDLEFYSPVPTEMLPNDDLDLQVVWACVIDKLADIRVDRHVLAGAWQEHVKFPWDEYGIALRNIANGLKPPLTGSHDNWFHHSMGSPIRSEIWACLAPGNPELAAAYAQEDACVDHDGEGVWGEMFFSALESMAFVENDVEILLDSAVLTLPEHSSIRRAVQDTRVWWKAERDWLKVRELILRDYGQDNFTDATMNIAFTVLGWLAGEGDFSRAICIATNCGKDTDCTAATVGALMGILDPTCIPDRWLAPIGRDLVLSPGIVGLNPPNTLDGFTDLVLDLRQRLNGRPPQAEVFEQSVEQLKLPARLAFTAELPADNAAPELQNPRSLIFDGTWKTWPASEFEAEYLLVEYGFHLDEARSVRVLFNTPLPSWAWIDGEFAFARDNGGVMVPALHRAPLDQTKDIALEAGSHTLTAAVRRSQDGRDAEWVVAIGDTETAQWVPETLWPNLERATLN
jgi:ADP-ribosylglycohydrolase